VGPVGHWGDKETAHRIILESMETAKAAKGLPAEEPRPLG
jgi:hypothetical protein